MPYNRWSITLQGANNSAFTGAETFTLYVTIADPVGDPMGEKKQYFGYINRRSRRGKYLLIKTTVYPFTVGVSDWDASAYKAFEDFLEYDFLRLTETDVPRLLAIYGSSLPLEVEWDALSSTLNAQAARNEVTIEFTSVHPI